MPESMWRTFLVLGFFSVAACAKDCVPYIVDNGVLACVCNSTYCDDTPDAEPKIPEKGSFYWYVSNKGGDRLRMSSGKFSPDENHSPSEEHLVLNRSKTYQTILGFGGAFTDSVGINIKKLSPATQDQLIRTYYDPKVGSRYNLGRVPIAGTDFSTRGYTYDEDENDTSLEHFALSKEDHEYKIPFVKKARELNPDVKLVSAAWTAPIWMKTNKQYNGFGNDGGFLKKEYYQTYADYIIKFLDAYKENGLDIWAVSTGNEPLNAFNPGFPLTTMGWTPEMLTNWVGNFMGPTLASSVHNETLILLLDDNRIVLPWFVTPTFADEKASKYAAGTAVHFYMDSVMPATVLDWVHDDYPDKIILMTEASTVPSSWGSPRVVSKIWSRAETYASSIIEYMNHWTVGWMDWNLVLDDKGGPNWLNNTNDVGVIVNPSKDEFYKTGIYYAIKHFSRFVDRNSVRVSVTDTAIIRATAFVTPSKEIVAVLCNRNKSSKTVIITDVDRGTMRLELSPNSINTVIYQ
ncbi:lysosomal acid glucosylceramidase isoform X1 [Megalopta genalis]|uniref:lysosomal acid glucosylceramidase isoform X1 n=1 Tax=Megalopta genalis TaxID=115081 RepID=UPI003FD01436